MYLCFCELTQSIRCDIIPFTLCWSITLLTFLTEHSIIVKFAKVEFHKCSREALTELDFFFGKWIAISPD